MEDSAKPRRDSQRSATADPAWRRRVGKAEDYGGGAARSGQPGGIEAFFLAMIDTA